MSQYKSTTKYPWMRSETDRMFDLFLSGHTVGQISEKMTRHPEVILAWLERYLSNSNDKLSRYEPKQRISRKGKPFTHQETNAIKRLRENKTPTDLIAKLLQRPLKEFTFGDAKEREQHQDIKRSIGGYGVDIIRAYRYLFYVMKKPVVSDETYDALKAEEMEFGAGGEILREKASTVVVDYPHHIRFLALYLSKKHSESVKASKGERVFYAIGEKDKFGGYGMWYGPTEDFSDIKTTPGKSNRSRVLRLAENGGRIELYKWVEETGKWRYIESK